MTVPEETPEGVTMVLARSLLLYLITGTLKQKNMRNISLQIDLMQIYINIKLYVLVMYCRYMNMKVFKKVREEEKGNILKSKKKV